MTGRVKTRNSWRKSAQALPTALDTRPAPSCRWGKSYSIPQGIRPVRWSACAMFLHPAFADVSNCRIGKPTLGSECEGSYALEALQGAKR